MTKYHPLLRILHATIGFLIVLELGMGLYMVSLPNDQSKFQIIALHKSVGVLILGFVVARLIVRLSTNIPPMSEITNKKIYIICAKLGHFFLYVLMISLPISGYLMSNSAGYPVHFFGIDMPIAISKDIALTKVLTNIHVYGAYIFICMIVLHLLGAMLHAKQNVLSRIYW